MLTPACPTPCVTAHLQGHRHPSHRASVPSVSGHNLFQLAAADFKAGIHHLSLLGTLAVPGVANPAQRATGNVPLASHHRCESPLEATLKQPFTCLQGGSRRPDLCGAKRLDSQSKKGTFTPQSAAMRSS